MAFAHDRRRPEAPQRGAAEPSGRVLAPGATRRAALLRQVVAPRGGIPNRTLARDLQGGATSFLPGPGAPSQVPAGPQRGPNPAEGIAALTRRILRPPPGSAAALRRAADAWSTAVVGLVSAGAAASGAPHAEAIAANEAAEIPQAVAQLLTDYFGTGSGASGADLRSGHEALLALAQRKEQEIRLQFHHNVIVETSNRGFFGFGRDDDLNRLDTALSGLPQQHVWGAQGRPLRFRRAMIAPGGSSASGETDPPTSTITIYDSGMNTAPYGRSSALALPGFEQTIVHEVGHTVETPLDPAVKAELFTGVMGWRQYSWDWVTTPGSPHETWQRERRALEEETGLRGPDLDTWLAGFPLRGGNNLRRSDTRVHGGRAYVRSATQGEHLHSILASETPAGPEFDYALTAHNDYLAELYTFAVTRPGWLAGKISRGQKAWLRRRMFGTPATDSEILHVAGMEPDAQIRFSRLVPGLFTWEQIERAIAAAAVPDSVA